MRRFYLNFEYSEENVKEVKSLGAKYEPSKKKWYYLAEDENPTFDKFKFEDNFDVGEGFRKIKEIYQAGHFNINNILKFSFICKGHKCSLFYCGDEALKDTFMFSFDVNKENYLISYLIEFDEIRYIYTFNTFIDNKIFPKISTIFDKKSDGRSDVKGFFQNVIDNIEKHVVSYERKDRMEGYSKNNPIDTAHFHYIGRRGMKDNQYEKISLYAGSEIADKIKKNGFNAWFTNDIFKARNLYAEIELKIGRIL